MNEYGAELHRVVDGDTIEFDVDLGFGLTKRIEARLDGVDTAETYGVSHSSSEYRAGKEQTHYVVMWLQEADSLVVRTEETGKYGRWLSEVENGDGDVLNDELISRFNVKSE